MKKNLKIILPLFIVVLVGLVWLFKPAKKTVPVTETPTRKVEQINQLAVKDRPFVILSLRADGKEMTITVDKVTNASKIEYEVEYNTKDIISGFFGTIDLSKETLPAVKKGLFGTCSKSVCRYDEGVSGGSLTLRFEGGDQPYVLKTDFNLQQMFDREGVFTSKDAKATLDVGRTGLPNATYLIISNTLGLPASLSQGGPEAVEGEVVAGPYSFVGAASPGLKNATISIQSKDDLNGAKLLFYNGKSYIELKATISDAKISAPVTGLGTFVVVK